MGNGRIAAGPTHHASLRSNEEGRAPEREPRNLFELRNTEFSDRDAITRPDARIQPSAAGFVRARSFFPKGVPFAASLAHQTHAEASVNGVFLRPSCLAELHLDSRYPVELS